MKGQERRGKGGTGRRGRSGEIEEGEEVGRGKRSEGPRKRGERERKWKGGTKRRY